MSNIPVDPKYTRFPFIVLPYSKSNMAVPKELMIDYENNNLYVKSEDGLSDISLTDPTLKDHILDFNNPHKLTKDQIDLGNVINVTQASKEEFDRHVTDYNNPHKLKKEHVGLGNVLNIMPASKEEFDELKRKHDELVIILEELKNRPGHATLYELQIDTEPPEAKVRVFYNNRWNDGKLHNVPDGEYSYEVFVSDDVQKFDLTIKPYPIDSDVYVFYNNTWNAGNTHLLENGTYQVKVLKTGYVERIESITIFNVFKTETIRLNKIGYTLTVNTIPEDATVKVYYDGGYNEGHTHINLPNGTYPVQVSKYGYIAKEEVITISNGNVTESIMLESNLYPLIVSVNPGDAKVEIFYNGVWNTGTTHSLPNGIYDIKVSKIGYVEYTGTVTINNINKTENVVLTKLAYNITIVTVPSGASVEVFYDNKWNTGKTHSLQTGSYDIKVSYPGYDVYNGTITVLNEDKVIPIDLSETLYSLYISTNPQNATVKVKINGYWETSPNNIFMVSNGVYEYIVNADIYKEYTGTVTINNASETVSVEMVRLTRLYIESDPIDAEVRVKINSNWVIGNDHWLDNGSYDIEVIKLGYDTHTETVIIDSVDITKTITLSKTLYTLTVNTVPLDSTVEVFYNDIWNAGSTHQLVNGIYNVRISKDNYITKDISTTINNSNKIENITLDIIKYLLTVNTTPEDSVVEVEYDGIWNIGKTHTLPNGTYNIQVTRNGYISQSKSIEILNSDKTEDIILIVDSYSLTVNTIPEESTVYITGPSGFTSTSKINTNIIKGEYTIKVSKELYYTDTTILSIDKDTIHDITLNVIGAPEDLADESKKINITINATPADSIINITSFNE